MHETPISSGHAAQACHGVLLVASTLTPNAVTPTSVQVKRQVPKSTEPDACMQARRRGNAPLQ